MHLCLQNLKRVIDDSDYLSYEEPERYDDTALRITDPLNQNTRGLITATIIHPFEIRLSIRLTGPIQPKDEKSKAEVLEYLLKLANKYTLTIALDHKNQVSVNARFGCRYDYTELLDELERNLENLRHFMHLESTKFVKHLKSKGLWNP